MKREPAGVFFLPNRKLMEVERILFSSRKRFDRENETILIGSSSSFFLLISIYESCSNLLSGMIIWGVFEGFRITRQSSWRMWKSTRIRQLCCVAAVSVFAFLKP
nr:hypothetical protein Iba_chr02aCG20210 [Ipomoea batatas]